jgi:SAM-dependent methyltransferase
MLRIFIRELAKVSANWRRRDDNKRGHMISSNDGVPFPSPELIFLVTNGRDPAVFEATGAADLNLVRMAIASAGVTLAASKLRVLDWGCGCGRLARHWSKDGTDVELFGCDINPTLVDWCKDNLKFGKFSVSHLDPPLEFEDNFFDLLYGVSVFTHLTFQEHYRWMCEIWRVLKPGGVAVLTAHGPTMFPAILANLKETSADDPGVLRTTLIDEDAFVCIERAGGSNFSANVLTEDVFSKIFFPFHVRLHSPRYGLMGIHDTYVITKKSDRALTFFDSLGQFALNGKRSVHDISIKLSGQRNFGILASVSNLFSVVPATSRLILRVSDSDAPLAASELFVLPRNASWSNLDAAHVLLTISDIPPHYGDARLSLEVGSDEPLNQASLMLSKAMLF